MSWTIPASGACGEPVLRDTVAGFGPHAHRAGRREQDVDLTAPRFRKAVAAVRTSRRSILSTKPTTIRRRIRVGRWAGIVTPTGASSMDEIRRFYTDRAPLLERAADRLQSILESVVATIEDKTLVRAEVRCVRVKELSSVQRKAESSGWKADQALLLCSDLIGGRVVCNNVEDAQRFAELLKEKLPSIWDEADVQDYTSEPSDGGYRALHVNFRLEVREHMLEPDLIPCEVQIRSRLQDAWAELSHDDIYKQSNLPEDLRARAKDLAEVLAAADRIATDIRSRVMRETECQENRPELGRVSAAGLAFCFREVFGRSPPDYAVRQALNSCDQLQILSLEGFPNVLGRTAFRDRVIRTYRSIIGIGIGIEQIFLAALYSFAEGDSGAMGWVREQARREREELEQFAKCEAIGSLPGAVEELIEALGEPDAEGDIDMWAVALGAIGDCAICGTTVIRPFSFAESAVLHYEVRGEREGVVLERIESSLRASDAETGGRGDGSLCAYHHKLAAKAARSR